MFCIYSVLKAEKSNNDSVFKAEKWGTNFTWLFCKMIKKDKVETITE